MNYRKSLIPLGPLGPLGPLASLASLAPLVLVGLLACSGGGSSNSTPTTPTTPAATTGSLTVTVAGLPTNRVASVQVTGPGGFNQTITATATLSSLTPGSYSLTAARVLDVALGYDAAVQTATVTAGGAAAATVNYALRSLARSNANRADENASPKYRIMYVLPSDGIDRNLDTDGTILRTVSSWERWFAAQTGGRYLRLDLSDGALDITFARLARTDAVMTSYGDFIRDSLEKQLVAAGYSSANTFLLVYYDGGHQTRCGSSAWPPALPGVVAAMYLKGAATSAVPCATNALAVTPTTAPAYFEFTAAHEALHLLGIVSSGAPNFSTSHVGINPTDVMYAGALPWQPSVLDVTKTNYYSTGTLAAGVTNLAVSPYLVP